MFPILHTTERPLRPRPEHAARGEHGGEDGVHVGGRHGQPRPAQARAVDAVRDDAAQLVFLITSLARRSVTDKRY